MNRNKRRKGNHATTTNQTLYGKSRGRGQLKLDDHNDDEIASSDDDSMISRSDSDVPSSDSEEEAAATVEDVKLRLAKEYLSKVEANVKSQKQHHQDSEDEDEDDRVGYELQLARREREGTLDQKLATHVQSYIGKQQQQQSSLVTQLRGHDLTPTCVALEASGQYAYSGSKDHSVFQWDVETQKRVRCIIPIYDKHNAESSHYRKRTDGEVLAMAVSDDGRYLATGGRDNLVHVFDIRTSRSGTNTTSLPVVAAKFKGHKSPVTSLTFRTQSLQLFSGSEDRCIRHYNLDEMAYVETLYGHQSAVMGIDCYRKERPVSIGRDRTMRAWKISEDSHLIFRGGSRASSADCISCVRDNWFVTGHDDGLLSLWLTEKKKPVTTIENAHGFGCGISSCDTVKGSDLCATGSNDGFLRLWKLSMGESLSERGVESIGEVPVRGYINDIAIGPKGRFCVAAVGQEHRLGRWNRIAKAKNRFTIIELRDDDEGDDDVDLDEDPPTSSMYPSSGNNADDSESENSSSSATPDEDDD